MTTNSAPALDEVLARLDAELAELGTKRAQAERDAAGYVSRMTFLERRMSTIQVATTTLNGLPSLANDQKSLDELTAWRKVLCDELLALPARIRTNHDLGKQQNLKLSIFVIDRGLGVLNDSGYALETLRLGALMREAGYTGQLPWHGSLSQVERRIQDIRKRRAQAEAQLADALLDDAERERLAAEDKARRDALQAAPIRKTRGDGSQYDRYPDGRVVEIT
jgi:hypothetical protein